MKVPPIAVLCSDEPLLKRERGDELIAAARHAYPHAQLRLFTASDLLGQEQANLAALQEELVEQNLFAQAADPQLQQAFAPARIIKIYLKGLDEITAQTLQLLARFTRDDVLTVVDLPVIAKKFLPPEPRGRTPAADPRVPGDQPAPASGVKARTPKGGRSKEALCRAALAQVRAAGGVVEIMYPPADDQLIGWTDRRLRRYGLKPDPAAVAYLARACEGNLSGIDQTARLLALTAPRQTLDPDTVSRALTGNSHYSGYEFAQYVCLGQGQHALTMLGAWCAQNTDLGQSLRVIIRHSAGMLTAVEAARRQKIRDPFSPEGRAFFLRSGIKTPPAQKAVVQAVNRMPATMLQYLQDELARADLHLSGLRLLQARQSLEQLCVAVSQPAAAGLQPLC